MVFKLIDMKKLFSKIKNEVLARPHADSYLYVGEIYAIGWRLAGSYEQFKED